MEHTPEAVTGEGKAPHKYVPSAINTERGKFCRVCAHKPSHAIHQTGEGTAPRKQWKVFESSMLENIVAVFDTKRELYAYNENHNLNADQIALFSAKYPEGFVFLGWDEIDLA